LTDDDISRKQKGRTRRPLAFDAALYRVDGRQFKEPMEPRARIF
jgi:hypothetical protein